MPGDSGEAAVAGSYRRIAPRSRSAFQGGPTLHSNVWSPGRTGLRDAGVALALFVTLAAAYHASPKRSLLDSKYALLTSEALLARGSWDLAPYLPELAAGARSDGDFLSRDWQLRAADGRLLYLYPPGIPILSAAPYSVLRLTGGSILDRRGVYKLEREARAQRTIAALLGAAAVLLTFCIARHELPIVPAATLALIVGLGSGYWSVVSRTIWSHSWSVVLLSAALVELLRWQDGERRRPELLAALLVAAFWARPTNAFGALAFTLVVARWHRGALTRLVATGGVGCALYLLYARLVWGSWLPQYAALIVQHGKLDSPSAFVGQLLSAEHGLLIFSPVLLALIWPLARYGFAPERRPAAWLSFGLVLAYLAFYSWRRRWWGAGPVGPRFLCDLTPFLAWLGAHAWRRAREVGSAAPAARWLARTAVAVLALASAAAHATGALHMTAVAPKSTPRAEEIAPIGSALWWQQLPQRTTARYLLRRLGSEERRPRG